MAIADIQFTGYPTDTATWWLWPFRRLWFAGLVSTEDANDHAKERVDGQSPFNHYPFVGEFGLNNVGQVDYLTANPPTADWYYSADVNPFDGISVREHTVAGLPGHSPNDFPNTINVLREIAGLTVELAHGK